MSARRCVPGTGWPRLPASRPSRRPPARGPPSTRPRCWPWTRAPTASSSAAARSSAPSGRGCAATLPWRWATRRIPRRGRPWPPRRPTGILSSPSKPPGPWHGWSRIEARLPRRLGHPVSLQSEAGAGLALPAPAGREEWEGGSAGDASAEREGDVAGLLAHREVGADPGRAQVAVAELVADQRLLRVGGGDAVADLGRLLAGEAEDVGRAERGQGRIGQRRELPADDEAGRERPRGKGRVARTVPATADERPRPDGRRIREDGAVGASGHRAGQRAGAVAV